MAFKLVRSAGSVHEPAVVNLPCSGVIRANSVVIFASPTTPVAASFVAPATTTLATGTSIIGVALDYKEGVSDAFTRVIPFVPGQLWEGDVLNLINTAQVLKRFRLYDSVTVENTSYDKSVDINAVFTCFEISGASTGSAKVIGTFRNLPWVTANTTNLFT